MGLEGYFSLDCPVCFDDMLPVLSWVLQVFEYDFPTCVVKACMKGRHAAHSAS